MYKIFSYKFYSGHTEPKRKNSHVGRSFAAFQPTSWTEHQVQELLPMAGSLASCTPGRSGPNTVGAEFSRSGNRKPHKFHRGIMFSWKIKCAGLGKRWIPALKRDHYFRYLWTKFLWWKTCNYHKKIWNLAPGLHGVIWGVAPRDRWFFEVCVGVARRWGPYYSYK